MLRPMIAPHVQTFFADSLSQQRRLSPHTIGSCRDTLRLFLTFLRNHAGVEPSAVRLADSDAPVVLRFLDDLEQERGNTVRSRNSRLSALRAFFRLVALREPDSLGVVTRVRAMPMKRQDKKLIGFLTRAEMQALLATPDAAHWSGRRDYALLVTRYNSGARVSALTALRRHQVAVDTSPFVRLIGKGRKDRTVPLWPATARVLKNWFEELENAPKAIACPNARGKALSREGVASLLQQAVQRAIPSCPSLATQHITPHVIRHTTAMHLLPAGVDIATIALWLGHESIDTTHMSLEAALARQEQALETLDPIPGSWKRFQAEDPLLRFLTSFSSCQGASYEVVTPHPLANGTWHAPALEMTPRTGALQD